MVAFAPVLLLLQAVAGRRPPDIKDATVPEVLVFGATMAVLALLLVLILVAVGKGIRRSRVRSKGEHATALVLALARAPGKGTRQAPGARLTVRVEVPGRAPYEAVILEGVHPLHVPRVQPGQRIPVIVDRGNPSFVVLDLDRA